MLKQLANRRSWLVLATGGLLVLACGCGTKLTSVEGNITWDGKPVESGAISFAPADGAGPAIGGEVKDGKYQLVGERGATPGKKTVTITAVRKTGKKIAAGPPEPPGTMVDELDRVSRTEACEIVEGKANQHNFELKSSKR